MRARSVSALVLQLGGSVKLASAKEKTVVNEFLDDEYTNSDQCGEVMTGIE